jgi:hypothetical protein
MKKINAHKNLSSVTLFLISVTNKCAIFCVLIDVSANIPFDGGRGFFIISFNSVFVYKNLIEVIQTHLYNIAEQLYPP